MSSRTKYLPFIALVCLATAAQNQPGTSMQAGQSVKKVAPVYVSPASGKDMYISYCAACHGPTGKGNGPAAAALKVAPTDLTQLAAKNAGNFPVEAVQAVLSGKQTVSAHGSADMPVWGRVFKSMGERDSMEVQQRIHNLSQYLQSLQEK